MRQNNKQNTFLLFRIKVWQSTSTFYGTRTYNKALKRALTTTYRHQRWSHETASNLRQCICCYHFCFYWTRSKFVDRHLEMRKVLQFSRFLCLLPPYLNKWWVDCNNIFKWAKAQLPNNLSRCLFWKSTSQSDLKWHLRLVGINLQGRNALNSAIIVVHSSKVTNMRYNRL